MNSPEKNEEAFEHRLRTDLHRLVEDHHPSPFLRQRVEHCAASKRRALNRKGPLAVAASVALLAVAVPVVSSGGSPDAEVFAGQGQAPPATTPPADDRGLTPESPSGADDLKPEPPAPTAGNVESEVPGDSAEPPDPAPKDGAPPPESTDEVLAGEQPPPTIPPPPAVPGSEQIAYVSSTDGGPTDIYLMNADGSGQSKVTNSGDTFEATAPAWSPDRTRIAFTGVSEETGVDIYAINADGTGQIRLTDFRGADASPAWSPDGTTIAYYRGEMDGTSGIWLMNSDGSDPRRLTDTGDTPTWSPDGSTIAYAVNSGTRGMFLMNADGTDQRRLTTNDFVNDPDWSPDGTKVAFQSGGVVGTNQSGTISVVNVDGSDERVITTALYYYGPSWSPDGARLVVAENCRLYRVDADGGDRQELATTGTCAEFPAWTA